MLFRSAENTDELKSLLKKSVSIIGICSVVMLLFSLVMVSPLSEIFVGYDDDLLALTKRGFYMYSFAFLFCGMAIFGSGFFTALNDGVTSALISFLRTVLFQVAAVLILPLIWGIDGVWISLVVAELMAMVTCGAFAVIKRNKYNYY